MKTKHTPGPWYMQSTRHNGNLQELWIDSDPRDHGDRKTGRRVICKDIKGKTDDETIANAARIVECVNACEGITDVDALLEAMAHAQAFIEKARASRDLWDELPIVAKAYLNNIHEALARAKGEA